MLELFSGRFFFVGSFAVACVLLAIRAVAVKTQVRFGKAYALLISLMAIGVTALFYGSLFAKPLLILVIVWSAFSARRIGLIPLSLAVVATLLPLLIVKVTMLPVLAMVGLSFISFRAIDVLVSSEKEENVNVLEYVAYVFFPLTLLAGPMYRWRTFREDMSRGFERISLDNTLRGLEIVLLGVSQKFLFAEAIDRYLLANIDSHDYSLRGIALNAVVYSVFLYFDFAGYSNMAVGIGKVLGLELPRNFNNPILAKNPQDFWRRWHISLSEWLSEVIFMPVSMTLCRIKWFSSRRLLAQNIGIFLTLLVMGTWNGLSLHYIVSGAMFGIYSVGFNIMLSYSRKNAGLGWLMSNSYSRFLGRIVTIAFEILAIYVFSGRSMI